MAQKSRTLVCLFLAVLLITAFIPVSSYAQQEESEQETKKTGTISDEEVPEVIVPAPKDQKEAIGIYVFLVWIWLSIIVLIYILRLKVKETDRIHQLKFFPEEKK